jgi:hypothetical protein
VSLLFTLELLINGKVFICVPECPIGNKFSHFRIPDVKKSRPALERAERVKPHA